MDIWTPNVGDSLFLIREEANPRDSHAVAMTLPNSTIVGHVPYGTLEPYSVTFLEEMLIKA